jgi:large subunit ribosomal protein L30
MNDEAKKMRKLTLTSSYIRCKPKQRKTLRALGLRKAGQSVVKELTPSIEGKINVVEHLVTQSDVE